MPRAKRRAPRARKEYSRTEILRLCVGIALGADRFGSGPGATKAMTLAWRTDSELRERVYEMFDRRASQRRVGKLTRPWACQFDEDIHGEGGAQSRDLDAEQDAAKSRGRVSRRRCGR